jgi:hypothetical protein
LNIISPNGSYVRTDNSSSPATVGTGTGGSAPEQYLAYHADNLTSTSPIQPYDTAVLQSVETGLWCRLAPLPSNSTQIGMVCDQATPATGTVLTYTGDGLSYNGIDLVATGPGQPLLLENTTAVPVPGPTKDNLTITPAPVGEPAALHAPAPASCIAVLACLPSSCSACREPLVCQRQSHCRQLARLAAWLAGCLPGWLAAAMAQQLHASCPSQACFPPAPAAGPPLPVDIPLNVLGPSGAYVRTDNASNLGYVGSGNGSTAPEQYVAYHASNTSERSPVQPGQTTYLQSEQTGMWCRLVPNPSNATQIGMVCDQPTSATAVVFTYTGDGLAVDGIQLVASGPGQPLLLANTTTTPVPPGTADNLTFVPVVNPAGEWQGACDAV